MPILQPLETSTVLGEIPGPALDRRLVRVVLAGDGRASALDLRRLIAADADLVGIGQAVAAHETLHQARDLQPDVVVLDHALSRDVVLLAAELTSLDRPPGVVVRTACPEPVMTIAAIIAGVRGLLTRSDPEGSICDAIRWVAGQGRWLPDIPLSALSRAGSRVGRNDLAILSMLLRGMPAADIAAHVGITVRSLDARRWAMLRSMLGEPAPASSYRAWRAGESLSPRESDPWAAIAA